MYLFVLDSCGLFLLFRSVVFFFIFISFNLDDEFNDIRIYSCRNLFLIDI